MYMNVLAQMRRVSFSLCAAIRYDDDDYAVAGVTNVVVAAAAAVVPLLFMCADRVCENECDAINATIYLVHL